MTPPLVYVRQSFPDSVAQDIDYQEHVKKQLVAQLATELLDKTEFRKYTNPNGFGHVYEASVIAMSLSDWQANDGPFHMRRGISNGTLAVMDNGRWKILGNSAVPSLTDITETTSEPVEPKKQSAIDYLTERMKRS